MRRRILACAVALSLLLLGASSAPASEFAIAGRIGATYVAAGGEPVWGVATSAETKLTLSGRNLYHQHVANGTIFWSSYTGGRTWKLGKVPSLSGVSNERDALASANLPGVVFRTAELCGASSKDKQLLTAMMHGGTIIDLRSSSKASDCPDPSLPTVSKVRYSMTSTTNPATFVTSSSDRASVAKVLRKILAEDGPILIHCTRGRDRTGWVVGVLLMLAGQPLDVVRAEYLRTSGTSSATFDKGITAMYDRYDGIEDYVMGGLGLSSDELAALQAELSA